MSGNFSTNHDVRDALRDGLLETDGTALTSDATSYVYAERHAEAVVLAYLWECNQRLANQWDPLRMTAFLPRWEKILGIRPLIGEADVDRRAKVLAKMQLYGQPGTEQVVNDLMTVVLGTLYAGIVNTSSSAATGFVPGGATVPGGVTLPDGDWYSSIAHVAIQTVQPVNVDDATFYEAVAQVGLYLSDLLPAWVTFNWFRDGPSGVGFFLDDPHNLDNERFA